jgi:D-proline reductase (dithiol) PrdB
VLRDVSNAVAVQLFRRMPWLSSLWARQHRFVESTAVPWARLARPVSESVVALVTTAGVHLRFDPPFDMEDPDGDASFRAIPRDVDPRDLTITHKYYDHSAADRDVNVVLPVDRLRELGAERAVGGIAPTFYSFMGHIDGPHLTRLIEHTAPIVARRLRAEGAQAVFLTPA